MGRNARLEQRKNRNTTGKKEQQYASDHHPAPGDRGHRHAPGVQRSQPIPGPATALPGTGEKSRIMLRQHQNLSEDPQSARRKREAEGKSSFDRVGRRTTRSRVSSTRRRSNP